jgi:hypothetical protein
VTVPANPYMALCPLWCPCHAPEWCADNPAIGCDLCRALHGHLTIPNYVDPMKEAMRDR